MVFVKIVKDCSRDSLMPVIQGQILKGSSIHQMAGRLMTGLSSMAVIIIAFTILRRFSSIRACVQFACRKSHINGIESFRVCTFHAPFAGAAKSVRLNLMDALQKFWAILKTKLVEAQSQK